MDSLDELAFLSRTHEQIQMKTASVAAVNFNIHKEKRLTRFLVARNYVVEDAFKQLKTAVKWRREYQPLTIQCKWCHETPGFHSVVSYYCCLFMYFKTFSED
ncbi:unnamed protein product [Schistosoma margrebowiei]|uniref:CRAL/TRIO N-terminal domain-containing protein n=1 Tax=Schistosoma margrebowiei TaxID=48269 RepID=A0A3P8HWG4_9TREM|nr:unnamed protein product [Schistosoma margrebowiei]